MRLKNSLPQNESISRDEIGIRAYMMSILDILSYSKNTSKIIEIAEQQYHDSKTMTLKLSSLSLLDRFSQGNRHRYIQEFIDAYKENPLVIMKYLALIGNSKHDDVVRNVSATAQESFYKKELPNHAKSLFGAFTRNLEYFHKKDGSGYALITDFILDIDTVNPHTAARMSGAFKLFPKLNTTSQDIMRPYLEKILNKE